MHVELEPRMRARLGCELGDISSRCRNPPSQLLPSRAATKQILLMAYGCAGCRSLLTWLCLTKQCKLLSPCDTCIGNSRHCWVNVGHWVNRYVPTYSLHLANVTAAKVGVRLRGLARETACGSSIPCPSPARQAEAADASHRRSALCIPGAQRLSLSLQVSFLLAPSSNFCRPAGHWAISMPAAWSTGTSSWAHSTHGSIGWIGRKALSPRGSVESLLCRCFRAAC